MFIFIFYFFWCKARGKENPSKRKKEKKNFACKRLHTESGRANRVVKTCCVACLYAPPNILGEEGGDGGGSDGVR